jgi:hypothetical protein
MEQIQSERKYDNRYNHKPLATSHQPALSSHVKSFILDDPGQRLAAIPKYTINPIPHISLLDITQIIYITFNVV